MTAVSLLALCRRIMTIAIWPALALVAWGELTPQPPQLPGPWVWDKLDHFTAYAGLALMGCLNRRPRLSPLVSFLAATALGGVLEILQDVVGRDAEWGDVLANAIGAGIGVALAWALLRWGGALVGGERRD
jgi:VanZ family protein